MWSLEQEKRRSPSWLNFIWVRDRSCPAKDGQSIKKKRRRIRNAYLEGEWVSNFVGSWSAKKIEKDVQYVPCSSAKKNKKKQSEFQRLCFYTCTSSSLCDQTVESLDTSQPIFISWRRRRQNLNPLEEPEGNEPPTKRFYSPHDVHVY